MSSVEHELMVWCCYCQAVHSDPGHYGLDEHGKPWPRRRFALAPTPDRGRSIRADHEGD